MVFYDLEEDNEEEKEKEEKPSEEPIDPIYELPVEETVKLGYEWVVEDDTSSYHEDKHDRIFFKSGDYTSIRRGSILSESPDGSPVQSNVDYIRSTYMDYTGVPHHNRAFDFSKSLADIEKVEPVFGGQSPHWLGTPQFTLYTGTNEAKQQGVREYSELTLASLEAQPRGSSNTTDIGNRPLSPDSYFREDSAEVFEPGPTRYSLALDGLNPWGLVGDDYVEMGPDENVEDEQSEGQEEESGLTPKERAILAFYNRKSNKPDLSESEEPSESSKTSQPQERRDQEPPQKQNASSKPNADRPYRDNYSPENYGYMDAPLRDRDQKQQRFQDQERPKPRNSGQRPEHTAAQEIIMKQIAQCHQQLDSAYNHLEESEIEKRRLIQQLSYLRLMELELEELQAINRIIAADVPAEEDIEILDRIIAKIKGPRVKFN